MPHNRCKNASTGGGKSRFGGFWGFIHPNLARKIPDSAVEIDAVLVVKIDGVHIEAAGGPDMASKDWVPIPSSIGLANSIHAKFAEACFEDSLSWKRGQGVNRGSCPDRSSNRCRLQGDKYLYRIFIHEIGR